jgi:ligand-binding sensor protein
MASSDYQRKQRQAELEAQENLNSAQEDELAGLQAINREIERELEHTKDLAKSLQKNLGLMEEQGDALRGIINVFTPLNERAASLFSTMNQLKNPLTAGFELIKLSAQRFAELDNAAMSFRQNTGFLASQTKQIETNIRVASRDLAGFGVTVEVASESAQQLANAFGDTAIANRENIEYVSLMKQNLGVSAEDSTALMQNFMGIGGMSSKVARETAGAAASMAKAAGVPYGAVMKEVAKPSAEVRSLIRGSVDALIKGAIEAKRLGTSLEAVGKAAAGMLDFQTSINDEMEASVLFGKDVNLQKARELAYAGDLENLAKEQSRLLQEAGNVSKMDYFQRMGIAKALGMSVEEMDKMNAKQQELNQLRLEDPETYEKLTAKQKVMDKTKESLSDKYKKELLSQQLASQQEKITASINQIMVEISEILLPILNGLMPIVSILLKISGIMVTLVLAPFKEFYNLVSKIWDYFAPGVDLFKLIADQLDRFSSFLKSDDIGRWGAGLTGLVILAVATFGSTTWTTVLVNAITWPFKLAFMGINKLMGNKIKDVVKTATDAAKSAASSASSAVQNVTSNVGGKGVAPAAAGPTSGGAGGGNKFMDTVKGIKPAQLLSLGVAMLAFAGAMYILAKAGQEFNSVDWSSLGKMATAAVVMGVTLGVLAAVMAPLQPILWPLVGVMLAFGAAMLAVGYSTKLFGEGFALMNNLDLLKIGMGLYTLSGAVLAFGASMAGGGMLSFLGGGMMLQLVALAAISPALNNASMALSSIGGTLQMFKDEAIVEGIENITEAIKGLNKEINNVNLLNVAGLALLGNTAKGAAGGGGDEVVNKLDELIGLMKSGAIAVNIDGTKVSTVVGVATKFRGAS